VIVIVIVKPRHVTRPARTPSHNLGVWGGGGRHALEGSRQARARGQSTRAVRRESGWITVSRK
jgi:hypothetical protein